MRNLDWPLVSFAHVYVICVHMCICHVCIYVKCVYICICHVCIYMYNVCVMCVWLYFSIPRSLLVEWMGGMGLKLCQLVPAGILLIGDSSISYFQEIWLLSHQDFQSFFPFPFPEKDKILGNFLKGLSSSFLEISVILGSLI